MGSATVQGPRWDAHAHDWAEVQEQTFLPLHAAALDAGRVRPGTRVLDAGCGAGLLALLATLRGASVAALDASAALCAIARTRLPRADVREGDLEALPFGDAPFDAVIAVNSVFYAADQAAAMRELARVTRPGGRVVITSWGPPAQCAYRIASVGVQRRLMPPPSTAPTSGPDALAAPGAFTAVLTQAGLRAVEQGAVACPFVYPDAETAWRGVVSAGGSQPLIEHCGEAAVRATWAEFARAHTRPDGSIHYENVFLWAVGERP